VLQKWHTKYGPIISIRIGPQVLVFLGSHDVAYDVMAKKGAWFSSRPQIKVLERLIQGQLSASLPYGKEWKDSRRFQHSILNPEMSKSYRPLLDLESKQVLRDMVTSNDFDKSFSRYAHSLSSNLNFGKARLKHDAIEIKETEDLIQGFFTELTSTNLLFDSIPFFGHFLNWVLGRESSRGRMGARIRALYTGYIKKAIANESQQSWAKGMAHDVSENSTEWHKLCLELFELNVGTSMTTQSALKTFVLAAILHPDAVARAQDELDLIIGSGRCPEFEDIPKLPYLNSFLKELLRWQAISPTAAPRSVTKDTSFAGYTVPVGTIVVASQSVINMDEGMFDKPEEFRGDRYVQNPELPEPAVFGYGRRSCPGQHLARDLLFIVVARLLWGYNIESSPEDPIENFDRTRSKAGFLFYWPYPFQATFQVRSADHQSTIERQSQGERDQNQS
jgi:cytochrome P450